MIRLDCLSIGLHQSDHRGNIGFRHIKLLLEAVYIRARPGENDETTISDNLTPCMRHNNNLTTLPPVDLFN